jgi:hypothetical protein
MLEELLDAAVLGDGDSLLGMVSGVTALHNAIFVKT